MEWPSLIVIVGHPLTSKCKFGRIDSGFEYIFVFFTYKILQIISMSGLVFRSNYSESERERERFEPMTNKGYIASHYTMPLFFY